MSCLSLSMKMNKSVSAQANSTNSLSECFVPWFSPEGAGRNFLGVLILSKLVGCARQCPYPVSLGDSLI